MKYNYAIDLIDKEIYLLESCISEGNWEGYSEALKDRNSKLTDLKNAKKAINETLGN